MQGKAIVTAGLMALALTSGLVGPMVAQATVRVAPVHRVSLNTGTSQELARVPGIGELMAQRIIAARPIRRVADLTALKGMTPKRFAKIRVFVTL